MTDLQRFNLYWLCNAMTAPASSEDLYYYDGLTKKFFVLSSSVLLDMVGLSLAASQAAELHKRLALIDSEASEIVEIPRLYISEKLTTQFRGKLTT